MTTAETPASSRSRFITADAGPAEMRFGGTGLTEVATQHLKKLLSLLHRGELRLPLTADELTRIGLQVVVGHVDVLRGLEEPGLRAVLVVVLAERAEAQTRLTQPIH